MYFDAIAKIVAERTGCDVADIKPESKFSELGIDSLDAVEIIMAIEEEFDIEVPDEEAEKFQIVGDIVKYVEEASN